jgi:hypothetical protein
MMDPLDFFWEHDDPVKSDIVGGDGRVLYTARTPWRIGHLTTTLARADGQVVAVVDWHTLHKDTIFLRGQQLCVRDWLPPAGVFTKCVRAGGYVCLRD